MANERASRCYLPDYKGGLPKNRYATANEAWTTWRIAVQSRPLMEIYSCDECTYFHLGNRRLTEEEWGSEQIRRSGLK